MRILGDTLGDRLTNLRTADGHSLRWIAEQVGISNPYLSQLESGKIVSPGSDVLAFSEISLTTINSKGC